MGQHSFETTGEEKEEIETRNATTNLEIVSSLDPGVRSRQDFRAEDGEFGDDLRWHPVEKILREVDDSGRSPVGDCFGGNLGIVVRQRPRSLLGVTLDVTPT